MRKLHVLSCLAVAAVPGCARTVVRPSVEQHGTTFTASRSGAMPSGGTLRIDAGVGDVTLTLVPGADSVRWGVRSRPEGCASIETTAGRLVSRPHGSHCRADWQVTAPVLDDLVVHTDVGDISVAAPSDRSLRLRANVGNVRVRLDGRALRHSGAPGAGDRLEIGDPASQPRIVAETGVGTVTASLITARRPSSSNAPPGPR